MTVKQAAKDARTTYARQKGEILDFMLLQVILRLIVLTPLLFLLSDHVKWLALLSIPLFLLIVPFARDRAARNMQAALDGGDLFSRDLLRLDGYGKSFAAGLKQGILLLLWALPFIGVTLWLYRIIFGTTVVGQTDVFSVIMWVTNLGGGDMIRGFVFAMLLYLATLLPFCFGLAFHSGRRKRENNSLLTIYQ